jgi:hypothetical protein
MATSRVEASGHADIWGVQAYTPKSAFASFALHAQIKL